jgi:hypothetical protein
MSSLVVVSQQSTTFVTRIFTLFFFEIKDSSDQGAWYGEEEMIALTGCGVVLLGGYCGDASDWTMSQRQEAP